MVNKLFLVLGVNGQDGSFLAEILLSKGYSVVGIGKQKCSKWIAESSCFKYKQLDLSKTHDFKSSLEIINPDTIVNAAAVHGSANFLYENFWHEAHAVNTLITHACLEYSRNSKKNIGYIYISSSKCFGENLPKIINENAELKSECIYSITKNSSTNLVNYYRRKHNIKSAVFWTFNHESLRRPPNYFIPKIVNLLHKAKSDINFKGEIGSLNFYCNWGHAREYMDIILEIYEKNIWEDFVLANSKTFFARDFVKKLFDDHNLNYQDHITELDKAIIQKKSWDIDITKLENAIFKTPSIDIYDICDELLLSIEI